MDRVAEIMEDSQRRVDAFFDEYRSSGREDYIGTLCKSLSAIPSNVFVSDDDPSRRAPMDRVAEIMRLATAYWSSPSEHTGECRDELRTAVQKLAAQAAEAERMRPVCEAAMAALRGGKPLDEIRFWSVAMDYRASLVAANLNPDATAPADAAQGAS